MRYGFYLPTRGGCATGEALETIVQRGEALGFHSVMIADHVVFPTAIASKYPYTVSGAFPGGGDALEQLALMAFVAGRTRTLRLVTSVMILPYRNPVLTAKMLATIDVLSRGRVTVGVGVGWLREEFEALRLARLRPPGRRQRRVHPHLQDAVDRESRELRRASSTSSARCAACRSPCRSRIRPSGSAATACRPCGGWRVTATAGIPSAPTPAVPLRPDELRASLDQLFRMTEAEGRNPAALTISFKAPVYDTSVTTLAGAERRPFAGTRPAGGRRHRRLREARRARAGLRLPQRAPHGDARSDGALRADDADGALTRPSG